MMNQNEIENLFLSCPKCGHKVHIGDSELHDIWSAHCSNFGECNAVYANVDRDRKEDEAVYRELASKWNAKVTAYNILHNNKYGK